MSESALIQLAKAGKMASLVESYHDLFPEEFWSDYLDVFKAIVDPILQVSTFLLKEVEPSPSTPSLFSIITQNKCAARINKLNYNLRGGTLSTFDYKKIKENPQLIKEQIEEDLYFDLKKELPFFKDKELQSFLKNFNEISFPKNSPFVLFCKMKNGKILGIKDTKTNYFYIKELETEEEKQEFIYLKNEEMDERFLLNFYELRNPSTTLFFILKEHLVNDEYDVLQFPEKSINIFYEKSVDSLFINKQFEKFLKIRNVEQVQEELEEIQSLFLTLSSSMMPHSIKENKEKCENIERYLFAAYYFIEMKKTDDEIESSSSLKFFKIKTIEDIRKVKETFPLLSATMKKEILEQALAILDCPLPLKEKKQPTTLTIENMEEYSSVEFPQIEGKVQLSENYTLVKKSKEKAKKDPR